MGLAEVLQQQAQAGQNASIYGASSYEADLFERAMETLESFKPQGFPRVTHTVPWPWPIKERGKVDSGESFTFTIDTRGETGIMQIKACWLQITRYEASASVKAATSGASGTIATQSTPSGGADTTGGTQHRHVVLRYSSHAAGGVAAIDRFIGAVDGSAVDVDLGHTGTSHGDIETGYEIGGSLHTHSTPNHTHPNHGHTIGTHGHNLTWGVFKNTGIVPSVINIIINGDNRSAALGGPWSSDPRINIWQYLVDNNSTKEPTRQLHTIELTSATLGELEITGYLRVNGRQFVG